MRNVFITVRNTHFTIDFTSPKYNNILSNILNSLTSKKMVYNKFTRRNMFVDDKSYYKKVKNKYWFNIAMLEKVIPTLKIHGIDRDMISVKYDRDYPVEPLDVTLSGDYEPRDYQWLYINELIKENAPSTMLVDLQTGMGKGYLTTYALTKLNMRTMFMLLPKYIPKWIPELKDYLDISSDDIYVIQGKDSLLELMGEDDPDYKFIIFSITTMVNYIRDYDKDNSSYPISPDNLIEYLRIGVTVNDETHQHFHGVYNAMLRFNSVKHIGLSATLVSNDKNLVSIYNTMYPDKCRISNLVKYNKYIEATAVRYRLGDIRGINYKRAQGYSHIMYEQSIVRNSVLLKDYLTMIDYYVSSEYVSRRKDGQKCLVFAASIIMCTIINNYLNRKYKQLNINRYVEDDPYENIIESDICVTTVQSGGTAIDIPGLITTVDTTSVGSQQSNIQALGRLREIKGVSVRYIYLYTSDINNQNKLHRLRQDAISSRVASSSYDVYGTTLRVR